MSDFKLPFDLRLCNEMDKHALLCCQKYNFDNKGDWFGIFRGGLQGFHYRINAVHEHFYKIHAWIPVPRTPENMDYHLTAILFNMHSAIECFTFALNALGNSVYVKGFWDVTNKQELRQIGSTKILAADPVYHKTSKDGFKKYFPRTQKLWRSNEDMLTIIRENHDVSKHRETIFRGGECRNDPPRGFFESLGVTYKSHGFMYSPMAETFLTANPMEPRLGKKTKSSRRRNIA